MIKPKSDKVVLQGLRLLNTFNILRQCFGKQCFILLQVTERRATILRASKFADFGLTDDDDEDVEQGFLLKKKREFKPDYLG